MDMTKERSPVNGCWVSQQLPSGTSRVGVVEQAIDAGTDSQAKVRWLRSKDTSIVPVSELRSGFKLGMDVMVTSSPQGRKLGEGSTVQVRSVAGAEQLLVEFHSSGHRRWIPYQCLRQIKGVKHAFVTGDPGSASAAESLRLKTLAHALTIWNENTGALSSLDIDPLPHQIHLVHHILNSGNLNWLIADDVGLGKTVETGMLLAALQQRGLVKRVLLITPAGLTRQWQEEMHDKFSLSDFEVYGYDFHINEPRHWKMHDHVIASVDRLKQDHHLEMLLQAEPWDLVIFDEAHRLSRRQYGLKFDSSDRFDLAANLRRQGKANAMLLLTGTPHQGMQDKFQALLELLRPERKEDLQLMNLKPEILGEMVIRNYKADVTDAEGNFVFHGKSTHAIRVPINDEARIFDKALQRYLKQGYSAGASLGRVGNAIGFVMTVYRKLAASSVASIHLALERRLARLRKEYEEEIESARYNGDVEDDRFQGEQDERLETEAKEFFEGEVELLQELISDAAALKNNDQKLRLFMSTLLDLLLAENSNEKILIFTEYRATQDYLRTALTERFGEGKVDLIHGGISHDERRAGINHFEGDGQFLISTEAGGEGINLQRQCHTMVNFDLPWNPMRLVQRIGRLYRYGQQHKVLVFNINSPDTVDEQIIDLMYRRIDQVVQDLATVQGDEFNDALKDDILGEVSDLVDLEAVLALSTTEGITRTKERIDDALRRASEAAGLQRELFQHAACFNPDELQDELVITTKHVEAFVTGMCQQLGIDLVQKTHGDRVWQLRLPETVMRVLGTRKSRIEITFDRVIGRQRPDTVMMDMNAPLMEQMIFTASRYEFGGKSAVVRTKHIKGDAFMAGQLRWQNELGQRMRQEFAAFVVKGGSVSHNPGALGQWLLEPAAQGEVAADMADNKTFIQLAEKAAEQRLAAQANRHLQPEQCEWVSAAWLNH